MTQRPGMTRRGGALETFAGGSACASATAEFIRQATVDLNMADQFEGEAFRLGLREPLVRKLSYSTVTVGATPATCGLPMPFAAMEFEGEDLRLGATSG